MEWISSVEGRPRPDRGKEARPWPLVITGSLESLIGTPSMYWEWWEVAVEVRWGDGSLKLLVLVLEYLLGELFRVEYRPWLYAHV